MRFWGILPVAIVGIALSDGAARADSVSLESVTEPPAARYIPAASDWNDGYAITDLVTGEHAQTVSADADSAVIVEPPPASQSAPGAKPSQVYALPLPSTVWSGAALLGVSAAAVWVRNRRRAGEISMT